MSIEQTLHPAQAVPAFRTGSWHAQMPDDKGMLRAARDLTRDLGEAKAAKSRDCSCVGKTIRR